MKRFLVALLVALSAAACVPAPSTPADPLAAREAAVIARFGIWAPALADVHFLVIPEGTGEYTDATPAWYDGPKLTVTMHDTAYSKSTYVLAHELGHALGLKLAGGASYIPPGTTLGQEQWADCTALAIGATSEAWLAQFATPYGCPPGGADAVAALLHIERAPQATFTPWDEK